MGLKGVAAGALCVLVLSVAAGAWYLHSVDLQRYGALLTQQVERATGRELRVHGRLDLTLSLRPVLSATEVTFSNSPWGAHPDMLRVERFEAQVGLLPLLRGELRVHRVALAGAEISVERHPEQGLNWTLQNRAWREGEPAWLPLVEDLRVRESSLTYLDHASGRRMRVALDELRAGADGFGTPVSLHARGAFRDAPFALEGELGALAALAGQGPYALSAAGRAGGARLAFEGRLPRAADAPVLRGRVAVEGPELGALSGLAGVPLPALGPYRARALLEAGAAGAHLTELQAEVGGTRAAGDVRIAAGGRRPRIEARLASPRLDLRRLWDGEMPAGATPAGERLFSPAPLPLAGLRRLDVDLDLELRAAELATPRLVVNEVHARAELSGGRLHVRRFEAAAAGGRIGGDFTLETRHQPPRASLELRAEKVDAGALLSRLAGARVLEGGRGDVFVSLAGEGDSPAALAASLDGRVRALVGKSRARVGTIDNVVGGATKLIGTLFSRGSDAATVNCLAGDFALRDGVAETRVLLADTEHSTVRGEGRIDLGAETFHLKLSPDPKTPTLNVAVPVHVRGPLADPTFSPDTLATARKVGGLIGAVFFPPAAIAGLADFGGGGNHCLALLGGAEYRTASGREASAGAARGEHAGADGAGAGEGGIASALKNLFSGDGEDEGRRPQGFGK